ncbi:phage tail tape measure protein [Heyndrickxia acidicola]|uniref:Phage tail tape measure protein n=1 Tax=Heyndrickxia acidicola TaxID=209389 RepID=A0ABU6MMD4_9BACI|nr:phage tail tape measure protein [Heyndrickxia acidicola]MED1205849.1 phage tail tape measure protein [Heyndrickxia acidicola]
MSEGVIIRVGLDGSKVTQSLKALKATVAASTSQMKAEMQIFKNAGDELGSLSAKHEGLTRTIKAQDIQIEKLVESYKKAKEQANGNTEATMKYANQINSARAKQESFKKQLQDTEIAMNDFKRGTNGIRDSLSLATRETNAMIDKLTAQGKSLRANKQEYIGLSAQMKERTRLIDAEKLKLQELIDKKGADSLATKNQRVAILELEAAQSSALSRYNTLKREVGSSSDLSLAFRQNINKLQSSISSMGDKITNAGHSMTMATLGIGAGFVYGTKQAVEFEKKLNDIKSLMISDGESTKEATKITKDMTTQAKELSNKYGVSIQSIGDAYETMVRKGDTGRQAMAAVEKMIKASTAAGSDFKETTTVSMNVMEQFFDKTKSASKTAENTTKVTNAMAYAADHGSAKFVELGYSMNYVGDYAKAVGYSMEDMSAYLEVMSRRGVEGTSAGEGLRGVMASLVKPSKQSAEAMADIGLKTKDSTGHLMKLSGIVEQLREKLKFTKDKNGNISLDADSAKLVSKMFGRTSLPTITALMTQSGKQLDEFSAKIKKAESTDYAGTVTKRMMQSGQNQLNKFRESLKNFSMDISATMLPTLTGVVQKLNSLMVKFDKLSPTTKKVFAGFALGAAAFAPLAIGVGSVFKAVNLTISGVRALSSGIIRLATSEKLVAAATKVWTGVQWLFNAAMDANPIGIAVVALGALVTAIVIAYNHSKTFRNIVNEVWGGIKKAFSVAVEYCTKALKELGNYFSNVWNDMKNVFKNVLGFFGSEFNFWKDLFTGKWSKLFGDIKTIFSNGWKLIKSIFKTEFDYLNDLTGGTLGKMWNSVSGIGGKVINYFKTLPGKMADGIRAGAKDLGNAGIFIGNKLIDGVQGVSNGVISGVNWILKKVDMPTIPSVNMPHIPYFAKGTWAGDPYAFTGGLAHVGDGGKHELIRFPNGQYAVSPNKDTLVNLPHGTSILGGDKTEQLFKSGSVPKFSLGTWLGSAKDFIAGGINKIKDIGSYLVDPTKLLNTVVAKFAGSSIAKLSGTFLDMAKGVTKLVINGAKKGITGLFQGSVNVPGNVKSWIANGMSIAGVSGSNWANGLSTIAMKESGGNPNAINLWDSNAKAGHPSAGLMQMIKSTFMSYAVKGHTSWMNPIDQVASDIGYIKSRYGSINNVPGLKSLSKGGKYVGYATGTPYHTGGDAILGDGGQYEPYLTPQGKFGISPNVPTLFKNLPAGTKVWSSLTKMKEDIPFFANGTSSDALKKAQEERKKEEEASKKAEAARKKAANDATTALKQRIADLKTDYRIGAISLKSYVSQLNSLRNAHGSTDTTRNTIKNNIYSAEKGSSSAQATAERKKAAAESKKVSDMIATVITDYRAGKINAKTEKARLDAIQKNHNLSTQQRNSIVSAIGVASRATQAKLNHFNNGIKSAATTYYNSIKSISDNLKSTIASNKSSVYGTYGLFDSVQANPMASGTNLTDNLMQQDQQLSQFNSVIAKLRKRKGMSSALVDEIEQMGAQNLPQASAIAGMNQSALSNYVSLWKKKNDVSNTIATDMSHADIASAKSQMDTATATFKANLKADASKYYQSGFSIGKYTVSGIVSGFDAMGGALQSATTSIGHTLINTIKKTLGIHSPSRVMKTLAGFTIDGITTGLIDNAHRVVTASKIIAGHITRNIVPVTNTDAINGLYKVVSTPNSGANHVQPKSTNTDNNAIQQQQLEAQLQQNQLLMTLVNQWGNAQIIMDKIPVGKMITPVVTQEQAKNTSRSNMVMGVRTT